MSLEQALAECTAAIAALTNQLKATAPLTGVSPLEGAKAAATVSPSPTAAQPEAPAQTEAEAVDAKVNAIVYDKVKAAIQTTVGTKGKPFVVAALTKFGVAVGPDLKPEQYADFLAELAK